MFVARFVSREGPQRLTPMLQVQAPAMNIPTDAEFFSHDDPKKPDHAFLKNHFYREGRVSEEHALYILEEGTKLLRAEANLLHVDAPVTGEPPARPCRLPAKPDNLQSAATSTASSTTCSSCFA